MSKLAAAKIIFRRIRGRLIPIKVSSKEAKTIGGVTLAGGFIGSRSGTDSSKMKQAK